MTYVNVDFSVRGHGQISDGLYSETFNVANKVEWEGVISSTTGYVVLPITALGHINKIIASSFGSYKVKITTGGTSIEMPAIGSFYYCLESVFSGTVTGISIATDSVTPITVAISLITVGV